MQHPHDSSRSLTSSLISLSLEAARHPSMLKNSDGHPATPPRTPLLTPPSPEPEVSSTTFQATTFPSHVRAHSLHAPKHSSHHLVRLLDDISTVTHSISSYVSQYHHNSEYPILDKAVATTSLYHALCHDGYACMILAKNETPLTFSDSAVNGPYVVMLTPLDVDPCEQPLSCGTSFSVYKRASPPSVSGTCLDLQQRLADQVAAGYVLYSSATTLTYTLGDGVFTFCLHPVATQYFLQTTKPLKFARGAVTKKVVTGLGGKVFDSGCFIADFDTAVRSGGVVLWYDVHLMCEAAPMALLAEQLGGRAIDSDCNRVLGMFSIRLLCYPNNSNFSPAVH
ncbi:Fructose-1-6-bisphosphatase [Gracilaria domingensis]|nr:Fructose-1-6-bisphosphatase [Gracilaria domingensis]